MKIRIDVDGLLRIERTGEPKPQGCPFAVNGEICGDWCPLFGEPGYSNYDAPEPAPDRLQICQGRTLEGEIVDERARP